MGTENSSQQVHAGRDAYVARGDIIVYNNSIDEDFSSPFLVIDEAFLNEERQKPKVPYIARPPVWADVVHGQNADVRFLDREQFNPLLSAVDRQLLEPLRRGTDRRLHTLFVTGAPGCGKSTLVRHAAATLVQRGDVLVADLGVNHGRLIADDLESYVKGLAQLAAGDRPVLLLMDDPFFANSGWGLLLETLARPNYSGIAVLGASPTYLYETYGRPLSGHQVVLNTFTLGATTSNERLSLAEMYGVRSDPAVSRAIGRHEDLLVFAMETASGNSFSQIIERIWSTLNDGLAITPKSSMADVEWPVIAFLLASYLHRQYVMCAEPLLRAYVVDQVKAMQTDFVAELSDLTLSEGWHIFRIAMQDMGASRIAMIGTMHARVAARAWQVRPFKAIDLANLLARASANAPECAPQLAEFILACQLSNDSHDRRVALKVAEQWRDDRISTSELSALVHGLRATPAARPFRGVLRDRLKRRDSQSWLAAAELITLERRGSPERARLSQIELPYCLKLADLSADSSVAIELLGSKSSARRLEFAATLRNSIEGVLGGGLAWELDGKLLIWLLRNQSDEEIHLLLPRIYDWLDARPEEERARIALIEWYASNAATIEPDEIGHLLHRVSEWVYLLPDNQNVTSAFFGLATALLKSADSPPTRLIEEISSWLDFRPGDAYLRERFLRLLAKHYSQAPEMAADAVTETLAWLAINPEADDVRWALLMLVLAAPGHAQTAQVICEAHTWLCRHPEDKRVRVAWVQLLQVAPVAAVQEAMPDVLAGLGDDQDNPGARSALSGLAHALSCHPNRAEIIDQACTWLGSHPDDGRVRAALLAVVRELPGHPHVGTIIADARRWLGRHPEDAKVRGSFVALARALPGYVEPAEVIREMLTWLADRPQDEQGHLALLRLALLDPNRPEAAEVIPQTVRWLQGHRGFHETWTALFRLVRTVPGHPEVADVVTAARQWLAENPDESLVRTSLLRFVRSRPVLRQATDVIADLVAETLNWLDQHPSDVSTRFGLLSLIRACEEHPHAREAIEQTYNWLTVNPQDIHVRRNLLALIWTLPEDLQADLVATEVLQWFYKHPKDADIQGGGLGPPRAGKPDPPDPEEIERVRAWLDQHPEDSDAWARFLILIRQLPGRPHAPEAIRHIRQWLTAHPDEAGVRAELFLLSLAIPQDPQAGEVISETFHWLTSHPGNGRLRMSHFFSALRDVLDHPQIPEVIEDIRLWLADHPEDYSTRIGLLRLVRLSPDSTATEEVVLETRIWLLGHPDDSRSRASMLALARTLPTYPENAEVVMETRRWLADHPEELQVRESLLAFVRALSGNLLLVDEVLRETCAWLTGHPDSLAIRIEILRLARRLPESPVTREIIVEARAWLVDHSDHTHNAEVRIGLLELVHQLPGTQVERDVMAEARTWLRQRPDDRSRTRILSLLHDVGGRLRRDPGLGDI